MQGATSPSPSSVAASRMTKRVGQMSEFIVFACLKGDAEKDENAENAEKKSMCFKNATSLRPLRPPLPPRCRSPLCLKNPELMLRCEFDQFRERRFAVDDFDRQPRQSAVGRRGDLVLAFAQVLER